VVLALDRVCQRHFDLPALRSSRKASSPSSGRLPARSDARISPNVFNIRASYADELEKIVDFYTTNGMKKFSVIHYDERWAGKPRRRGNGADPAPG